MATLAMNTSWSITFTTAELRLVLKALGGRLKPEEIEPAKQLGDQISLTRAQTSIQMAKEMEKLLENITAAS